MRWKRFFINGMAAVFAVAAHAQSPDYLKALQAMKAELQRSMSELRTEDFPGLYFLGYRLTFSHTYGVQCAQGSVGMEYEYRRQIPFVEARVGSYERDNTWEGFATGEALPYGSLDVDEATLRHHFWYLTDRVYKNSLRRYLDKQAHLAQELETEKLPDFSREASQVSLELKESVPPLDRERLRSLCRHASREFRKYPQLDSSDVRLEYDSEVRLLTNSEGTELIYETRYTPYALFISAEARAPDGLAVDSFRVLRVRSAAELPDDAGASQFVAEVAAEVAALKKAPIQMPELAPAILDGESTAVFFHEALGHRLEGQRQREAAELQTFKNKVGTRIIPSFLNVYSDAALPRLGRQALSGHYLYDSEGIPSRRIPLVEGGVLKNYLMSRRPIAGFTQSNGSGRSDPYSLAEGRMSVLVVEPRVAQSARELKKRLLEEIKRQGKPFGFKLVAMRSGEAQTRRGSSQSFVSRPRLIYRVDPGGKEILVRGLEYVGTPLAAIEKIIAAGDDASVSNGFCGSDSGWIPVTGIAPSVLLSELELQRQPEDRFRPPILKSPVFQ